MVPCLSAEKDWKTKILSRKLKKSKICTLFSPTQFFYAKATIGKYLNNVLFLLFLLVIPIFVILKIKNFT